MGQKRGGIAAKCSLQKTSGRQGGSLASRRSPARSAEAARCRWTRRPLSRVKNLCVHLFAATAWRSERPAVSSRRCCAAQFSGKAEKTRSESLLAAAYRAPIRRFFAILYSALLVFGDSGWLSFVWSRFFHSFAFSYNYNHFQEGTPITPGYHPEDSLSLKGGQIFAPGHEKGQKRRLKRFRSILSRFFLFNGFFLLDVS